MVSTFSRDTARPVSLPGSSEQPARPEPCGEGGLLTQSVAQVAALLLRRALGLACLALGLGVLSAAQGSSGFLEPASELVERAAGLVALPGLHPNLHVH